MKRSIACFILMLSACFLPMMAYAEYRLFVQETPPMVKAVKGHFAAYVKGDLRTWGGYYTQPNQYNPADSIRFDPIAYGATAHVPEGGLFIGGRGADFVTSQVLLFKDVPHRLPNSMWKYDASGRRQCAALPYPLSYHAATFVEGESSQVFVVGGCNDSVPNDKLLCLEWPTGTQWNVAASLPGAPRIRPLLLPISKGLLLVGGYKSIDKQGHCEGWQKNGLLYDIKTKNWQELSWQDTPDSLFPAPGCVALSLSAHAAAFIGGKESEGKYRSHLVVYNVRKNEWKWCEGNSALARYDASLSPYRDGWMLSGGEVAPYRNTSAATYFRIECNESSFPFCFVTLLIMAFAISMAYYMWMRGKA